jgi:ADP-ribosyl-[dinitrogen reductase] hydrolase
MSRTSLTHPLQIGTVPLPGGGGIGLTLCPGKHQPDALTGSWRRDLAADLDSARAWGAAAVVTLMEPHELAAFNVAGLGEAVEARGMEWHHLPIRDVDVPDEQFEARWIYAGLRL